MKKKVLVIVITVVLLIVAVVAAVILINKRSDTKTPVDTLTQNFESEMAGETLGAYLVWQDQAGFTFSYPEEWLFDTHEQDVVNYANIDITKRGYEGGIKILAVDSKYKTVADWTKKDALVADSSFMETKLGSVNAQKALLKTGGMIIGAVDEGVLFTLELKPDEAGYWEAEYDKIIASFRLVYPTNYPVKTTGSGAGSASAGSSADIIEEAEEVIE